MINAAQHFHHNNFPTFKIPAYSWLEYTFQKEGNTNEFSTSTLASENDISRWWEKAKKEKVNLLATLLCVIYDDLFTYYVLLHDCLHGPT